MLRKVTLPHVGGMPVHLHYVAVPASPALRALDDLPTGRPIAVTFLLHGRKQDSGTLDEVAEALLHRCAGPERERELVVVTFDLRNHGHRRVHALANEAWREGNVAHAQDMFSIQVGTAQDLSLLVSLLPAYLPPTARVELWACVGVSLGGHATWLALVHEPRITVGVPIIGCCDFLALMRDRIHRLRHRRGGAVASGKEEDGQDDEASEEERWMSAALKAALSHLDPAAMGEAAVEAIKRKKVLVLCGAEDRLVPFHCSQAFIERVRDAHDQQRPHEQRNRHQDEDERRDDAGVCELVTEDGKGHELSENMVAAAGHWLARWACAVPHDGGRPGARL